MAIDQNPVHGHSWRDTLRAHATMWKNDPRDPRSLRRRLLRAVLVPLSMLLFVTAMLLWQLRAQSEAGRWVDHTDRVISALHQAQSIVVDAESGVRGYLVTHDETYLEPYYRSGRESPEMFRTLEQLVTDNPAQLVRVRELRAAHARWCSYARQTLDLESRQPAAASMAHHLAGKLMVDDERARFATMIANEERLRAGRVEQASRVARIAIMSAFAATLVLGALLAWFTRRELTTVAQRYAEMLSLENRARRSAEAASRLKDDFLGTISHELRTPLTAILGWVQMLRAGAVPEDRRPNALDAIERNARAQAQIIDDLLDVSRIVSGKLRIDSTQVEFKNVVQSALDAVQPAADAKQIKITLGPAPDVTTVMGDAERLQQVLWNLLSNAVKFTPRGGSVQVVLRQVHSSVEIEVSDTGIGIRRELLPHVFERFWQADAGVTRAHGGLGIGLALVRHLVEQHGGTVAVTSEGANLGTTFTVRLPIAQVRRSMPKLELGAVEERSNGSADVEGLNILVVDDEPDTRELIASILKHRHAHVSTASSAIEALEAVNASAPDVIVSDIGMPDVDGYELIRRLRARGACDGGRTPAVALTAYARAEDRSQAIAAGFDVHVSKPVGSDELAKAVARAAHRV